MSDNKDAFQWRRKGKCHKFGHDMGHDGPVMNFKYVIDRVTDPEILIPHVFEESDPEFRTRAKRGDIIIAGRNFGKGKAHVQGYIAMQAMGIGMLCESMPFLTYRGAISVGLMLMAECAGVSEMAEGGDDIDVDFSSGKFINLTRDYYDAAFAEFDPAQVRFLVFSDDLAWCRETFANTPNLCFSDAPSPVVDMCAMSLCDHNIIANSSFSFWGAFLNRHAGKRVFCPAKTLKSDRAIPHLNHGWYPDEFTAIEAGNV